MIYISHFIINRPTPTKLDNLARELRKFGVKSIRISYEKTSSGKTLLVFNDMENAILDVLKISKTRAAALSNYSFRTGDNEYFEARAEAHARILRIIYKYGGEGF